MPLAKPAAGFRAVVLTALVPLLLLAAPAQGPVQAEEAFPNRPISRQIPVIRNGDLRPLLSASDHTAALEAVHTALSEVEDGATYVWRRDHGRLGGTFKPTLSYRDNTGRTCRHVVMQLAAGAYVRRSEGVACRSTDGSWLLEG